MLTFYEMLELVESRYDTPEGDYKRNAAQNAGREFANDNRLGMNRGEHGYAPRPAKIGDGSRVIKGSAEDMERSRGTSHLSKSGNGRRFGLKRGDIEDIGTHLDRSPEEELKAVPHLPDSGFDHGQVVPRSGKLGSNMIDATADGEKADVSSEPNPTRKRTQVKMSQGYNMAATKTAKSRIDSAIKHLHLVKQATPDKLVDSVKDFLSMLGEIDTPHLHPDLKKTIAQQKEKAKKIIDRETKIYGIPAQDKPHTSPMAKYMLRKHSKVF